MTEALPPEKDGAEVAILPPVIFLLHVIAGIVLDWLLPLNFGRAWGVVGLLLLGAGFFLVRHCITIFDEAGTNVRPGQPTTTIVETGPYRLSRNPIYLAFVVGFVGLAMLADAPVMLLLALSLFYILDRKVIVPEEQYLETKFGQSYLDYKQRVRRWI